jgi:hypothetical protein
MLFIRDDGLGGLRDFLVGKSRMVLTLHVATAYSASGLGTELVPPPAVLSIIAATQL